MARRQFSKPSHAKEERNGPPGATKAFLQPSPEAAMLFAPFGYTHPPPLVSRLSVGTEPKFKDIARSDFTSSKSADFN